MAGYGPAIFFVLLSVKISSDVKRILRLALTTYCLCLAIHATAQKQLVLLKKEEVILRLRPGDEFIYKLKGSKTTKTSYVNNLFDDAVLAHNDTIPFHTIERIYFRQSKFYNTIGGVLVVGGAGLFLIDQINVVIVNGDSPSLDNRVSTISIASIAAGLPLMMIRKKSQKLNHKYRLLTAERGSIFYLKDPRTPISPFLEN